MLLERAPAKINLTLRVHGRRDDGYHDLESLVAFSGAGDLLTLEPGGAFSLVVDGPTAGGAGELADNLVAKAARAFEARFAGSRAGAFRLTKRLPVAAGVGGGSSDAAAALRLLARVNGVAMDDPKLLDAARSIGSDVPVCLAARARVMRGAGETLGPILAPPPLYAVLVNPGVATPTPAVFARLGLKPGEASGFGGHPEFRDDMSHVEMVSALTACGNDLEKPAVAGAPVVSDVLDAIAATPGCELARMSGSGATCFGLFASCHEAAKAARRLRLGHADWWAKATLLR